MNIRQRLTLLITLVGFVSSLAFSSFIFLEMLERPYELRKVDADMHKAAQMAVTDIVQGHDEPLGLPEAILPAGCLFEVYDLKENRLVYRAPLPDTAQVSPLVSLAGASRKQQIDTGQAHPISIRLNTFTLNADGRTFKVISGYPIDQFEVEIVDIALGVATGLALSLLLLLGISYFTAGYMLKPIRDINKRVKEISEKHLDRRMVVTDRNDEFNELAVTLNQVFDRLQYAFFLQKRFLSDAAHELKTPLTMMRLALDDINASLDKTADLHTETHQRLTELVLRMERLAKGLLDLSALELESTVERQPIDLGQMIGDLIEDYQIMAVPLGIAIDQELPEQLFFYGDRKKLSRAFSNLLDNAIKYNQQNGEIKVSGIILQEAININIVNTGAGIPESELPFIFDQFYRVEQSRALQYGGSGLGLAIVKRIIVQHAGTISVQSEIMGWTRVTLSLPIQTAGH